MAKQDNHPDAPQRQRKGAKSPALPSGWRMTWAMVMFDLPVVSKGERRRAKQFHDDLIEEGFTMKQFSIYLRFFPSRSKAEACADRIAKRVPKEGSVSILFITDKQMGQMRNYTGKIPSANEQKPSQLALF